MYFVHDATNLSYYLGSIEPKPGFAKKLLFEQSYPIIAVDTETISLKERIAIGVGIATNPETAFYFRLFPEESPIVPWHLFKDTKITKVAHNILFDWTALREYEVDNCLHPKTRVLRSNLTWDTLDNISVGDELIGIDEYPNKSLRRKLRKSVVEKVERITLPAYAIVMVNGKCIITGKHHPWLIESKKDMATKNRRNQWEETQYLQEGDYIRNISDTWESDTSYEAGYVAGFLDGEGSISPTHNNFITVSQLESDTFNRFISILRSKGFNPTIYNHQTTKGKPFKQAQICNQREVMRLLGSTHPNRLLQKFDIEGKEPPDEGSEIESITELFPMELIDIQTSTKTFIAEGFITHNSNILDTSIMSRLLGYKFNSLIDLSMVHQTPITEAKEMIPKGGTMLDVDQDEVARKCCYDCLATYKLYQDFWARVDQDYVATEMQVIPICIEMSNRGLKIDQKMRAEVEVQLQEQADFYLSLCEGEGFNPGSPQQVAYMLAKRGAYKVFHKLPFTRNYKKRSLSTAVEILEEMDDPLASIVLAYRGYSKLLSTYIRPWAGEERATTRFHLDAITGRPSSTDRNMQNIPGKFRKDGTEYPVNCRGILVPDNEVWTDVDWEQLEPRCLSYLADDKEMQHIFSLPKYLPDGSRNLEADIHYQVGEFMGIPRRLGKTINLAMTYGATDETLMEESGIKNRDRVRQLKVMWGRKFPQAMDWIDSRQEDALRTGMAATIFGRKIRLPSLEEDSADGIRRKAIDYPCQGSAAEILKRGLIITKDLPVALQIHDEQLVDGYFPKHKFEALEHIAPFTTPVEVKYLSRWE